MENMKERVKLGKEYKLSPKKEHEDYHSFLENKLFESRAEVKQLQLKSNSIRKSTEKAKKSLEKSLENTPCFECAIDDALRIKLDCMFKEIIS